MSRKNNPLTNNISREAAFNARAAKLAADPEVIQLRAESDAIIAEHSAAAALAEMEAMTGANTLKATGRELMEALVELEAEDTAPHPGALEDVAPEIAAEIADTLPGSEKAKANIAALNTNQKVEVWIDFARYVTKPDSRYQRAVDLFGLEVADALNGANWIEQSYRGRAAKSALLNQVLLLEQGGKIQKASAAIVNVEVDKQKETNKVTTATKTNKSNKAATQTPAAAAPHTQVIGRWTLTVTEEGGKQAISLTPEGMAYEITHRAGTREAAIRWAISKVEMREKRLDNVAKVLDKAAALEGGTVNIANLDTDEKLQGVTVARAREFFEANAPQRLEAKVAGGTKPAAAPVDTKPATEKKAGRGKNGGGKAEGAADTAAPTARAGRVSRDRQAQIDNAAKLQEKIDAERAELQALLKSEMGMSDETVGNMSMAALRSTAAAHRKVEGAKAALPTTPAEFIETVTDILSTPAKGRKGLAAEKNPSRRSHAAVAATQAVPKAVSARKKSA